MNAVSLPAELPTHPAADLFPLLTDDELQPLIDSMRRHGFDAAKPIIRYGGAILDGRNRLRAATIAGVEPIFADLPERNDPYQESWKQNGLRRDLSPGQKAAIVVKITTASADWQTEREDRRRAANKARVESNQTQPRISGGRFGTKTAVPSGEGRADKHANDTSTRLAQKAGVARSTIEKAMRLQKEDPARFDAVIRGEKPARTRRKEERDAAVLRLHREAGLGSEEISRRLNVPPSTVSDSKARLGIARNSPSFKLWSDIQHAVASLLGASVQLEKLAEQVATAELNATEEEVTQCIKKLRKPLATVRALRSALKAKVQT